MTRHRLCRGLPIRVRHRQPARHPRHLCRRPRASQRTMTIPILHRARRGATTRRSRQRAGFAPGATAPHALAATCRRTLRPRHRSRHLPLRAASSKPTSSCGCHLVRARATRIASACRRRCGCTLGSLALHYGSTSGALAVAAAAASRLPPPPPAAVAAVAAASSAALAALAARRATFSTLCLSSRLCQASMDLLWWSAMRRFTEAARPLWR